MASAISRTTAAVLTISGALGLAVALTVALVPVRTSQLNYPSCGSALVPNGGGNFNSGNFTWDLLDNSLYRNLCENALAPMRGWAITLAIIGLILLIWGIVALVRTPKPSALMPNSSVAAQLSEIARLKETGALTDEEFAAAKSRIVSGEQTSKVAE